MRYNLELRSATERGHYALALTEVVQEAGASRSVQPRDWRNLKSSDVVEQ